LSGGMQQRAAIARTLSADPKLILMDEPFGALDALTRESMQIHLRDIWEQTRKTIFFITHDVEEALLLATRIVVMHAHPGRIVQDLSNPFAHRLGGESAAKLRLSREFVEMREQLVDSIRSPQISAYDS
jgi:taurine transport system ATP-binding protein